MKHTEYKIFTEFKFEEEEKWINEKAAKGENLTDIGFFRYAFEDGDPGEYIYRLEMLEHFPNHYKSREYLLFLEETGVEFVGSILNWVYLRKKASEGPFEIYSDIDSKIKHYKRIVNLVNSLILLQVIVSIPNIILSFTENHSINNIYILNLILAVLFLIGNRSIKQKIKKLEKEKHIESKWRSYQMQINVNNICKSFGDKKVLEGISLSCESGKALGLLGRNGAGKTTTIRIIMGVFPADSGEILLDGKPINRKKVKIGYLPEERGLYPKKLVMEQLVYLAELRGLKASEAKKSAKMLLEKLEMTEYENKKLDTLSKGNQQKIQLIATLTCDPDIVILDEPFSGLDPVNAMLLKDTVKELIANGKVVIFSSHQMNYVEEFCNDIAILNKGKIVKAGNIKEIKKSYDRNKIVVSGTEIEKIKHYAENNLKSIVANTQINKDMLLVELVNADMKNNLMTKLAEENFDIDKFYVYEPSLNDIFVEYTE